LAGIVAGSYDPDALGRGLAGTRCMAVAMLEDLGSADRDCFQDLPPQFVLRGYDALGLAWREAVIYLDIMDRCLRLTSLAPAARLKAVRALDLEIRPRCTFGVVLRDLRAGFSHHFVQDLNALARARAAQVALVVEQYRRAEGDLPQNLGLLMPNRLQTVPDDPIAGKPLRYLRLGRGFVVYSVGQDGKDDGGAEPLPRRQRTAGETYDTTFTIER
jgi:hypothetical protein